MSNQQTSVQTVYCQGLASPSFIKPGSGRGMQDLPLHNDNFHPCQSLPPWKNLTTPMCILISFLCGRLEAIWCCVLIKLRGAVFHLYIEYTAHVYLPSMVISEFILAGADGFSPLAATFSKLSTRLKKYNSRIFVTNKKIGQHVCDPASSG